MDGGGQARPFEQSLEEEKQPALYTCRGSSRLQQGKCRTPRRVQSRTIE